MTSPLGSCHLLRTGGGGGAGRGDATEREGRRQVKLFPFDKKRGGGGVLVLLNGGGGGKFTKSLGVVLTQKLKVLTI